MSDHRHEAHDIYGTAATSGDVGHLDSLMAGLREDLGQAEARIRDLESQIETVTSDVRVLWTHVGAMRGGI